MKKLLTFVLALFSFSFLLNATNYYAAPNGTGDGTSYESPTTWSTALGALHSGDSLFLLGGTYSFTAKQSINVAGTEDARTFIGAYPGEKPVFDFRNQPYGKEDNGGHDNTGISIGGNYIHLKGIELCYTGKSGLVNGGSFCLFENLDVHGCGDTGIQMKAGNNTILNCDSHDNFDYKLGGTDAADFGGNADGFADKKYAAAPGNHYIGCRAWNNSDDGWDFFERISTSETIIENCICYANGPATYDMSEHPRYNKDKAWFDQFKDGRWVINADGNDVYVTWAEYPNMGNGNGFKLGGDNTAHNAIVHHCLSVANPVKGFDQNNDAGTLYLYNNTAYNNGKDYGFPNDNGCKLYIQNCISYASQSDNSLNIAVTNDHNTWNEGFAVSEADFQSLDESLILAARNADGSLPENAFMRLTDKSALIDAGADVGYSYKGNAPDLGCYESSINKPQTAILSWYMGEGGDPATSANSITGAVGSAAEGFTITITGNTEKKWNKGNGNITYQSASYLTLKNSNGAQNTVTLPEGKYAHKVDFYATSNPKDGTVTQQGKLSELNGVTYNDVVESVKDYSNPTHISKTLETPTNQFTFTFSAQQVCFIAVITYSSSSTPLEPEEPEEPEDPEDPEDPEERAFTDFKIDFRSSEQQYTVVLPTSGILPDNVTLSNLKYHGNQHGLNGGTITVDVNGPVKFTLGACHYGTNILLQKNGVAQDPIDNKTDCDNTGAGNGYNHYVTWIYNSEEAATLSFTVNGYLPYFSAEGTELLPEKSASGYYEITAGDAAEFLRVLAAVEAGDKIFLPNGVYDLGERVLTAVNVNNLSIIGESMEGTIIKNAPDYHTESINNTATLLISSSVSGTYLQDLTLRNDLEYEKAIADPSLDGGRAIALQDEGTQTICKNVRLLSYQDTYYCHKQGAFNLFEDCEIHGTVDYICGSGSIYFKNCLLYNEQNSKGVDYITAHNGKAYEKGYVFEGCTIQSECAVVSFGRAWNNSPKVAFLNSVADNSAGDFEFTDNSKNPRWTKQLMNPNAWPEFGEYNTRTTGDVLLTPSSNVVTFINKGSSDTKDLETVLSAEQAATYTMAYTLGEWAATATADVAQATADQKAIDADAAYLIENEGEFVEIVKGANLAAAIGSYTGKTMRQANSRGAFGAPVKINDKPTAIEEISESTNTGVIKFIKDGQLVLKYNGVLYNVQGQVVGK